MVSQDQIELRDPGEEQALGAGREETRTPKIGAMRLILSGQIDRKIVLFYLFIYITYYFFSSQK